MRAEGVFANKAQVALVFGSLLAQDLIIDSGLLTIESFDEICVWKTEYFRFWF